MILYIAQKILGLFVIGVSVIIVTPIAVSGQVNYLEESKTLNASCRKVDSASVISDFYHLDSISKLEITDGEGLFFSDFAMNYYYQYMLWHRSSDQDSCIKFSKIAWEQYHDLRALWTLAFNLIHSGRHQEGVRYLEAFITENEQEEIPLDYIQISRLYKKAYSTAAGLTE
jgi:hypothetical protein